MLHLYAGVVWQIAELKDWLRRPAGQGMVEYALIIALVAIVLVAALAAVSTGPKKIFNSITNTLITN